jgi:protease I
MARKSPHSHRANAMTATVLILNGDDYEDLELHYPRLRLIEAGYRTALVGAQAGAQHRSKHGYPSHNDCALSDVRATDFAGIVLPGGWMPDKLRRNAHVLELVRAFDTQGKLVASICHGPWIAISAGVVRGKTYTGSLGIKDDLVNAGARFVDQSVAVDGCHVSSRKPDDLPDFMAASLVTLNARHQQAR